MVIRASANMETGEVREDNELSSASAQQQAQTSQPGSLGNKETGTTRVTFTENGAYTSTDRVTSGSSSGRVVDSGSILGNARNQYSKAPEAVNDNSLVTLPDGVGETNVFTAIQMGYVERDPSTGGYREVPQGERQPAVSQSEQAKAQEDSEKARAWNSNPLDKGTQDLLNDFHMVYGEDFANSVLAITVDMAAKGSLEEGHEAKFNEFASRAKMDPEKFNGVIEKTMNGLADQAARYISRTHKGVDGRDVMDWLTSGEIAEDNVREILNRHTQDGDLKVYDYVVKSYLANR